MEADEAQDVEELLGHGRGHRRRPDDHRVRGHPRQASRPPQAIDRLRELQPDAKSIYYVYVTDDDERVLGVLSLRDLIVAKPGTPIADLMIKRVIAVPLDARPEDVAAVIAKYNLLAVPVVDDDSVFRGSSPSTTPWTR